MTLFRYKTANSRISNAVYYECLHSIIALMDPDYYSCYVKFMGLEKSADSNQPFSFSAVMNDFQINVRRSVHGGIYLLSNYDDIVYTQSGDGFETDDDFREAIRYWKESYSTVFRKFCSYEFIGNFKSCMKILSIMMELRSNGVVKTVGELIDYLTSFYVLVSDSIEEDTTEMWLNNDLCLIKNGDYGIDLVKGVKHGTPNVLNLKEVITETVNCILEMREESCCSIDSLVSLGDKYKDASGVALLLNQNEVKYLFSQIRAFLCSNRKIYNRRALVCSLFMAENIFLCNNNAAIYIDFTPEHFNGITEEPNVLYSSDTSWSQFTFVKPPLVEECEYLAINTIDFQVICGDLQSYNENQGGIVSGGRYLQFDTVSREMFSFPYSGDLLELQQRKAKLSKEASKGVQEKLDSVKKELRSLRLKISEKITIDLCADYREFPVLITENKKSTESIFEPESFCFLINDYREESSYSETVKYTFKDNNSVENNIPLDSMSVAISCMLSYIYKECIDKSSNNRDCVNGGDDGDAAFLMAAELQPADDFHFSSNDRAQYINAFVDNAGNSFDDHFVDYVDERIPVIGSVDKEEEIHVIDLGTVTVLEAHVYWMSYKIPETYDYYKSLREYAATTTESCDSLELCRTKDYLFSCIACNLFPVINTLSVV